MRKYFLTLLFIIAVIFVNITFAQNRLNFNQFRSETEDFLKQPSKWTGKDWSIVGLSAASSLLLMQFDDGLRDQILMSRENIFNMPAEFGRIWGEPYNTILICGVNAISGVVNNIYINKKIAFEIAQSAIYTGLTTQILKILFGRSRPYNNEGAFSFSPFSFSDDEWALPSGHTSLGFSLSTVLSENSKSGFMKVVYYLPAFLTAYSRVYQDKHWLSDVFLGAVIGYTIGKWTVKIHEKNEGQFNPVPQFNFYIKF